MTRHPWEALRSVLVIAHPGHELRIHHWLERARPLILVLTDGSGHTDNSRLAATTSLLEKVGATPGRLYGRFSDRQLYEAILAADMDLFSGLIEEIAETLARAGADYAVGDAVEGFNPTHDLCRLLLNAALKRHAELSGRHLRNFEFLVEGAPQNCPAEDRTDAIFLDLDDAAYRRKVAAVQSYTGMSADVTRLLDNFGPEAFRAECLRPVRYGLDIGDRFAHPPYYEGYGAQQVAAGFYREVIRFRRHIAPLADQLMEEPLRSDYRAHRRAR